VALRRALHFVFKVGDRSKTANFYRDVLGMKILRQKEFEEGCKSTCKGPDDGKWSKTTPNTFKLIFSQYLTFNPSTNALS
uniref:VOC domain-containing protein n=1 Tax=Hucho hucho TaxID=62062 RepID=A0A4W5KTA5_9TELE